MRRLCKKLFDSPSALFSALLLILFLLLGGCEYEEARIPLSDRQIERHIQAVLELPCYEYVYRDVVYIADQASFLGIRHRDTQLLFAVDVRLQAGIDLQKGLSLTKLGGSRVKIQLPQPEVLMVDADEASIHQYFKKEFGGEISRLDYYDEISLSKERITQDAINRGILDQARTNAASLVRNVLGAGGIQEVDIEFRQAGGTEASP